MRGCEDKHQKHSVFTSSRTCWCKCFIIQSASLKPGELVGVNKDTYILLEKLPDEYDSRVKSMEIDEKPSEEYTDIGGLDKQIEELREAIVLPITHK